MTLRFDDDEPSNLVANLPTDVFERAMVLRDGLVSHCADGGIDTDVYRVLRRELMNDPVTSKLLPRFIRTHQTADGALWSFFKSVSPHWEPRRKFVREEFAPLLEMLERGAAFADTVISEGIASFDAAGVMGAWNKALARRDTDPAGAITAARTLLETVCKHLLEDADGNSEYGQNDDLPKLYRMTSERLNIAPSQHSEDAFKRILGSAASVVEGLGTLRNKIGDAHASGGRKPVKVAPRHAALAVNLAGSMALFLIETAVAKGVG
ncbi:abortive infection Abi-like protein [Sphingomonas sp. PP-F2F-G114-C0414]|uniref:abortive infection family protein n=1 Tax=Sphingomonas sp. PP-F2F-G114-C0414 TaxID=2135662 RepID=UPI000EF893FD|nr:abortive infection family protein [Sphingomonas sp. PP-F2F-G114-C0414]RMB27736.1 abortive infection Abi-like protein [Sphingomonas sp. PP-F2F-G114-C0414]